MGRRRGAVAVSVLILVLSIFIKIRRDQFAGIGLRLRTQILSSQRSSSNSSSRLVNSFELSILESIPVPVRKYFLYALPEPRTAFNKGYIEQRGDFAISSGQWSPFTAKQIFTAGELPPAFVWSADISMGKTYPLSSVTVSVIDSYAKGGGGLRASVLQLITVAEDVGSREVLEGTLMRYLAEAVWYPTALVPSQHGNTKIGWESLPPTEKGLAQGLDDRAKVTLTDAGVSVSIDCQFDGAGQIVRMSSLRYKSNNGGTGYTLTPWYCIMRDYALVKGGEVRVPFNATVGWINDNGKEEPYYIGTVVKLLYDDDMPQ